MGLDITGIGSVADLAKTAINAIWPNKTEQEKAELAAAVMVVQGQLDINREEAKNPNVFVSGWRPAIGWICGMACAWNWIGLPIVQTSVTVLGYEPLPIRPADLAEMFPILLGMLGLGGLRTVEKVNKVAAK